MKKIIFTAIILAFFILNAQPATADMYFSSISNSPIDLSGQLHVNIINIGTSQVLFTFFNDVGINSGIGGVFFDDRTSLLSNIIVSKNTDPIPYTSLGVDFEIPNGNGAFPQGNNLNPAFEVTFKATKYNSESNSIDHSGEYLGILFNGSLAAVLGAINDGNLRVGLHVQSIEGSCGSDSDSYINTRTTVPVPGAVLLGMLGLAVAGSKLRKFA